VTVPTRISTLSLHDALPISMLLELEGDVRVYVRHNEATPIFHPKLYGFRSGVECRVLVGSNNMTGAGLSQNEEVAALLVILGKRSEEHTSELQSRRDLVCRL